MEYFLLETHLHINEDVIYKLVAVNQSNLLRGIPP